MNDLDTCEMDLVLSLQTVEFAGDNTAIQTPTTCSCSHISVLCCG